MLFGLAVSGIQSFLYDLSPETPSRQERAENVENSRDRNAARRLRMRSAVLTLVPGAVALALTRADPSARILYLGGGKLLAEASAGAIDQLAAGPLEELFEWLLLSSGGQLGAYWTALDAPDCTSDSLAELIGQLNVAKWRSGRSAGWHGMSARILSESPSQQLGDRTWESEQGALFAAREDWTGFALDDSKGWKIGPWHLRPVDDPRPDISLLGKSEGRIAVAIPTYMPKAEGKTRPLFDLAERMADGSSRTTGAPYLALLKADGDGIGRKMAESLSQGLQPYLKESGQLTDFFGRKLADTLAREFPTIYLVYSGGDDLVAIGWFDDVLRAARRISALFGSQVKGSGISAGVAFFKRQSPVLHAIERAEFELENAKSSKNAIGIGGAILSWSEFDEVMSHVDSFAEGVESDAFYRGGLQLLRQLGEPWMVNAPKLQADKKHRSLPMAEYHFAQARRASDVEKWPPGIKDVLQSLKTSDSLWPHISLIASLAAWRTRRLGEDN